MTLCRNLPPSCPQRIETPPAADAKKMDIGEVHAPSRTVGCSVKYLQSQNYIDLRVAYWAFVNQSFGLVRDIPSRNMKRPNGCTQLISSDPWHAFMEVSTQVSPPFLPGQRHHRRRGLTFLFLRNKGFRWAYLVEGVQPGHRSRRHRVKPGNWRSFGHMNSLVCWETWTGA